METHLRNKSLHAQNKSCDFASTDHVVRKMAESEKYVWIDILNFFEKNKYIK